MQWESLKQKLLNMLSILKMFSPGTQVPAVEYLWDTPDNARHSARMIMDTFGLSWAEKDLLCAVLMAESGFKNTAKNENLRSDGTLSSTDWGICQINDRYHIGQGSDFPSVDYVLGNPDKVIQWFVRMYKQGHLNWWCAYSSGAYKQYL